MRRKLNPSKSLKKNLNPGESSIKAKEKTPKNRIEKNPLKDHNQANLTHLTRAHPIAVIVQLLSIRNIEANTVRKAGSIGIRAVERIEKKDQEMRKSGDTDRDRSTKEEDDDGSH